MITRFTLLFVFLLPQLVRSDLRMASSPKDDFIVESSDGAIPFVKESVAFYMEPSDFEYQGLRDQRRDNFDNFLRSNVDNEQDNRDFVTEIGRDMLPFRTLEANSESTDVINTAINTQTLIPLRWNNPHSSECEINIWITSSNNDSIVVPIKKPSCCAEGYQDNMLAFTIPSDFKNLSTKIPGFTGCNQIGDCTLQIYAHSVEPRTYAIGTPIIISDSNVQPGTYTPATNTDQIEPQTLDPQLRIGMLPRDICLPTTNITSNYVSAVPRFARLVSDQFNHAYQNSDFSPYSGQQHELISRNLQSATILRMIAANGGELGRSLLNSQEQEFITSLINKVNAVVQKYEAAANEIINNIKSDYESTGNVGNQALATCFRCSDTGSVNPERIEQQTYIPSFEITGDVNQIRNMLNNDVKRLIPANSNSVQIYKASLFELSNDFVRASNMGFVYQPAMIKNTITTMEDVTNFLKVDSNGENDDGVYASTIAMRTKQQNIENILFRLYNSTTSPPPPSVPTDTIPSNTNTGPISNNTLPPNPDDLV